jgi:hypothetical protein
MTRILANKSSDDLELCAMRHREFSRATVGIPQERWDTYADFVKATAGGMYFSYKKQLAYTCVDLADVEQYARIWSLSFLHGYYSEDKPKTKGNLKNYLWQRMNELVKLHKKSQHLFTPDRGTLEAYYYSDCNLQSEWTFTDGESKEEESKFYKPMNRRKARKKLNEAIEATPDALQRLAEAAQNEYLSVDARKLAKRLHRRYSTSSQEA